MVGTILALALSALAVALAVLLPFSVWKELQAFKAERGPAALAAQVEELRGLVDVLRASNRREFGSLWKTIGRAGLRRTDPTPDSEPQVELPVANDDSFDALIKLQSTPPVKPT